MAVTGQIRTTIGQAQLLIDQRFNQFSGLIDLSEVSYISFPHNMFHFVHFMKAHSYMVITKQGDLLYFQTDLDYTVSLLNQLKINQ